MILMNHAKNVNRNDTKTSSLKERSGFHMKKFNKDENYKS